MDFPSEGKRSRARTMISPFSPKRCFSRNNLSSGGHELRADDTRKCPLNPRRRRRPLGSFPSDCEVVGASHRGQFALDIGPCNSSARRYLED